MRTFFPLATKICNRKTSSTYKMFYLKRQGCLKLLLFATISLAAIIILIVYANTFITNLSPSSVLLENRNRQHNEQRVKSTPSKELVLSIKEEVDDHNNYLQPPINASAQERIVWFREVLSNFEILKSTTLSRKFHSRVEDFLASNQCKIHFFMAWIAPGRSFGERELYTIESLFKAHPKGCLILLSRSMDSAYGYRILKPLLDFGNKILAVTPDLSFLLENTPAHSWLGQLKAGKIDPGEIPLEQNLSNLIRLAALYKYGGVYMDTDFIILNNFLGLRNSVGAQSVDLSGNWTRLNNAVLIFDKNHQLVYKFLEEFASTFDGNKWGSNGPYLVSRVVKRIPKEEFNFTILPPMAFYPVDWTKVKGLFEKPITDIHSKWVEAKLVQLRGRTYGVHLWNKQSSGLRIEEGSIIRRLITENCCICKNLSSFVPA